MYKFPDFFFVQAFKIVVDSWKFSMLLLYILWDDWPIFMISASNEQLQQQLEYTLLKPDFHSYWILKMQSGHEDTLEERYAIKFCFKLFNHLAWVELLSGIRDSRKAGILWGMMQGVGGVRKSIHQSWLAKGLGLGLLCWGFEGVQEEIPWEERSQHSSNRVSGFSTRTMHQSTTPSLSQTIWPRWASRQLLTLPIVQTLLPVTSVNILTAFLQRGKIPPHLQVKLPVMFEDGILVTEQPLIQQPKRSSDL